MMNIRNEMMQTHDRLRHRTSRPSTTKWPPPGSREIDMRVRRAGAHGRQDDDLQVHHQERRQASTTRPSPSCPSRCSATTAPACTRTSRSGRAASRCSPAAAMPGLSEMALHAIGGLLKHAPSILAFTNPDDQQLQAAGARLRGAGEPGLFAAQPLGQLPHSDVQPQPQGQAASSSAAPTRVAIRTWPSRPC